jgi:hypothetical protein
VTMTEEREKRAYSPRRYHAKDGEAFVAQFADGRWRTFEELCAGSPLPRDVVDDLVKGIRKNGNYGCSLEFKRTGGQSYRVRLFRSAKTVSLDEIRAKFGPLLDKLEAEGRKNMATASPREVAYLTKQLKAIVEAWGE